MTLLTNPLCRIAFSFLVVAFGQPAWCGWLGLVAAAGGYSLLWNVTGTCSAKGRFWWGTGWYSAVQVVQLSWMFSHPYKYIYAVVLILSVTLGLLFGGLTWLITPARLKLLPKVFGIAAAWTVVEWGRLFFLSGLSFNPIGLALTGHLLPLQMATLFGIFGLTFWVILGNLLLIRCWWLGFSRLRTTVVVAVILFPYFFGVAHVAFRDRMASFSHTLSAVIVNLAFSPEEKQGFHTVSDYIDCATEEWRGVLGALKGVPIQPGDLLIFPEFFVPFGADYPIYDYEQVKNVFVELFGKEAIVHFPPLQAPWAHEIPLRHESSWLVSNSYWIFTLMRMWQCDLLIGLEDVGEVKGKKVAYNAALFFPFAAPESGQSYAKCVLVPLGEYIPFSWLKAWAARYGISDSFCHGGGVKIFKTSKEAIPFGVSICYEETFGHMMKENRRKGAELLINLTSDAWYPNSKLAWQHYDLARLRTVEMGIPLIRSCNYGVSGAIDSLGRPIFLLGGEAHPKENSAQAARVEVPIVTYNTLYSYWGDAFMIALCGLMGFVLLVYNYLNRANL